MKVRDGHVSNSSSSSFVLMTTKENYERALAEADPYVKAVAKALVDKDESKQTFLGRKMVVFSHYSDSGGNGTFSYLEVKCAPPRREDVQHDEEDDDLNEDEDYCEEEAKYLAWQKFQDLLNKNKTEVISARTGG